MARSRLDQVLPRRSQGDLLIDALATWTTTRGAALANAVDTLTAAALAGWTSPRAGTAHTFQAEWLRAVTDPVGRGWAAANLVEKLPGRDRVERAAALALRLRAALEVTADPRIGAAIARHVLAEDALFAFAETLRLAEEVLIACRDERMRAAFAGARDLDEDVAALIERVLAKPPLGRAPTRRELERFATAASPRAAAHTNLPTLLAEVFARPDDDGPRSVLADALQATGDPRGELIALQLAPPSEAGYKRIDQLIKACGRGWLGDLAAITNRAQFRRGFLSRLELAKSYQGSVPEFRQICEHPTLATIEELISGDSHGAPYATLVTSPAMKSLRRIEVYDTDSIVGLETTPHPLTHVACPRLKRGSGNYVKGLVQRVLPACRKRSSITSIGVQLEGFDALASSGLLGRLTSVTVGDNDLGKVLAVWKQLPTTTGLVAKRYAGLEACLALRVAWLGELTIAREDGALVGRAWGDWPIAAVDEHSAALPKLERLILLGGTTAVAKRIQKTSKIEVVLEPAPIRSGYVTTGR